METKSKIAALVAVVGAQINSSGCDPFGDCNKRNGQEGSEHPDFSCESNLINSSSERDQLGEGMGVVKDDQVIEQADQEGIKDTVESTKERMRKSNENFEMKKTELRNSFEDKKRKLFEKSEENNRIMEEDKRKNFEEINRKAEERKKVIG